jgi:hypothetical protein
MPHNLANVFEGRAHAQQAQGKGMAHSVEARSLDWHTGGPNGTFQALTHSARGEGAGRGMLAEKQMTVGGGRTPALQVFDQCFGDLVREWQQ